MKIAVGEGYLRPLAAAAVVAFLVSCAAVAGVVVYDGIAGAPISLKSSTPFDLNIVNQEQDMSLCVKKSWCNNQFGTIEFSSCKMANESVSQFKQRATQELNEAMQEFPEDC